MRYFLRIGDDSLDDAKPYPTKRGAVDAYRAVAEELARYGQSIEASLHIAPNRGEINEYPDFVMSLGPRGGVRVDAA